MTQNPSISEDINLSQQAYAMLGIIGNAWAILEISMDLMNAVMFRSYGANAFETRIPLALKQKLKFNRRCALKMPVMAQHRDEISSIVDHALQLVPHRHTMVHGMAVKSPGGIKFTTTTNLNTDMNVGDVTYSMAQMADFAARSNALANRAYVVNAAFMEQWYERSSKKAGDVGVGE